MSSFASFFKKAVLGSDLSRGFTLLEILVAFLVLDAGLLGLAALQREMLLQQQAAGLASDALWLTEDLAARCRANPGAAYRLAEGSAPPPAPDCRSSPCSPSAWAAADIARWHDRLRLQLPLATGEVNPSGDACLVRLRYRLPGGDWAGAETGQ